MILCVCLSPAIDITYRVTQFDLGATNRVTDVLHRPGGKAVNVARLLHDLGTDCALLAPIGGRAGDEFAALLAESGVVADLIPSAHETRRTVTVVEESSATVLVEPATLDCWPELLARYVADVPEVDVVVVSGAPPAGVPDHAFAALVEAAHPVPVIVDTSGPGLHDAIAAGAALVKPNAEELRELTGVDDTPGAARALARPGTVVLASLGADGLFAVCGDETWTARPGAALTGNPTGAGDAVVAAAARGLSTGAPMPELLADCVALAAAAVLSPVAGEVDLDDYAAQRVGVEVAAVTG